MIVVTGGAGFIGSAIIWKLNQMGETNILVVDDLGIDDKWKNLVGLKYANIMNIDDFHHQLDEESIPVDIHSIIHMGACSATTECDADFLLYNNYKFTQELCRYCVLHKVRFVYASSAATYGDGSNGYLDDEAKLDSLRPLNMYGYSKHLFDLWAQKENIINKIAGVKFFNVYGPNESHKEDMRSVVNKAFSQINETGKLKLFKSYVDGYADGEQKRDFIYVKDAVDMTLFLMKNPGINGLYNLGTGKSRTWNDLAKAIFSAMGKPVNIEYIDMPESLRPKYQYYTQADVSKLRAAGYDAPIASIEEGVKDYIQNYLMPDKLLAW
jgi:ADP-L-glycero-D-manno-heptose 6-epimerase